MSIDDFKCPLEKIQPLGKYFSEEDPDPNVCRPCRLTPLAEMYLGTLEDAGENKLAEELKQTYEAGDVLTIAKTMDIIKAGVGSQEVRSSLEQLDCAAQAFKGTQEAD